MLCIAIRFTTDLPFEYLVGVSHKEYFKNIQAFLFLLKGKETSSCMLDFLGLNNFPYDLKFYK